MTPNAPPDRRSFLLRTTSLAVTMPHAAHAAIGHIAQEYNVQFISVSSHGAAGDGTTDDTAALRAALEAERLVRFGPGTYRITGPLTLRSGHVITMLPGTVIRQERANQPIFTATREHGLVIDCNGAVLEGEGSWSADWRGNGAHTDRALSFFGCDDVTIVRPHVRNCAHSGIAFVGGKRIRLLLPIVEGTHRHGTPIPREGNFQIGIYLRHDPGFGAVDDVVVLSPDISGTAQGILSELEVGAPVPAIGITVNGALIHDIPGQHAFYIQAGNIALVDPIMSDIALSGVKIQAGVADVDLTNVTVTGAQGRNIGSQLFEIAAPDPYLGKIRAVRVQGLGEQVGRGLGITRMVENLTADIVVEGCSDAAVQLNGPGLHDLDITVQARDVSGDGVVVYATESDGLRIRPVIRDANAANGPTACGIRVASPSAEVTLFDPDVTDDAGRMRYGLFNAVAGADVKVHGSARFTGAADTAVRATGRISAFPADAILQGAHGAFTGLDRIGGSEPLLVRAATEGPANTILWQRTLNPGATVLVTVELLARRADKAEHRATLLRGCFSRVTAEAQVLGTVDEHLLTPPVPFGAAYALRASGSQVVLVVSSGGQETYLWMAKATAATM